MKIVVVANDALKAELSAQGLQETADVEWVEEPSKVDGATAYIDLLFKADPERINGLRHLAPALVMVNAVALTLSSLPAGFTRFNGWPGFLKRPVVEAACAWQADKTKIEQVFLAFNKSVEWVPDIPGFISARVVSMIINEAYFALGENISSPEEIDTAMKLGTGYPYGPFEWGRLVGLTNIHTLLEAMSAVNPRYEPSPLLKEQARYK